jgi:hypothetical protein
MGKRNARKDAADQTKNEVSVSMHVELQCKTITLCACSRKRLVSSSESWRAGEAWQALFGRVHEAAGAPATPAVVRDITDCKRVSTARFSSRASCIAADRHTIAMYRGMVFVFGLSQRVETTKPLIAP